MKLSRYKIVLSSAAPLGDFCLRSNESLKEFHATNITYIGKHFLMRNRPLHTLNTPNIKEFGTQSLMFNTALRQVSFSQLEKVGDLFLSDNECIESICFPKLKKTGKYFMSGTRVVKVQLPKLHIIETGLLHACLRLKTLDIGRGQYGRASGCMFVHDLVRLREREKAKDEII